MNADGPPFVLCAPLLATLFTIACGDDPAPATTTGTTDPGGSRGAESGGVGGGAGGTGGAREEDILDQLKAIAGLSVSEATSKFQGYRRFVLEYDQPENQKEPGGQRFKQRVVLQHRSADAPLVLVTAGYDIHPGLQYQSEPTELLQANELLVEHRFFTSSRPEPASWAELTIEQAAADHHRIVTAFKPLYPSRWITTGVSKGGMTSVYHRRFYPDDVDGTVVYVAPESFGLADPRYLGFLEQVGDAACRDALKSFQKEALARRPAMLAAMQEHAAQAGLTYDILGADRAFEIAVVELPFMFWQYNDASLCPTIPSASSTDDAVWRFLDKINGPAFWSDRLLLRFEPYYFQAGTELGYPAYAEDYLAPHLMYPGIDVPATFVVKGPGKAMTFHPEAMKDVSNWVTTQAKAMLFIYGQNDPYSAAAFDIGTGEATYRFFVPKGNHGSEIGDLADADKQKALDALFAWAGKEPGQFAAGGSKAARAAALRPRFWVE
jgi:hypothetical protein